VPVLLSWKICQLFYLSRVLSQDGTELNSNIDGAYKRYKNSEVEIS